MSSKYLTLFTQLLFTENARFVSSSTSFLCYWTKGLPLCQGFPFHLFFTDKQTLWEYWSCCGWFYSLLTQMITSLGNHWFEGFFSGGFITEIFSVCVTVAEIRHQSCCNGQSHLHLSQGRAPYSLQCLHARTGLSHCLPQWRESPFITVSAGKSGPLPGRLHCKTYFTPPPSQPASSLYSQQSVFGFLR